MPLGDAKTRCFRRGRDQQGHLNRIAQQRGCLFAGLWRTQNQATPLTAIFNGRNGIGRRQHRGGDQRGNFGRGLFGLRRPARHFANIYKMNRPLFNRRRPFGVFVQFQEQTALLRASHQQRFTRFGCTLKLRRLAAAQRGEMGLNRAGARRVLRRGLRPALRL